MKKTLLILSLCASMLLPSKAAAQDDAPTSFNVFSNAVFYGMYEATVQDKPIPEGAIRNSNSSYGKKLTEDQLNSIGNTLTMTVTLNPLCDNYDRIGNVNMVFVPKGATSYNYHSVRRIEIGRFITPFMNKNNMTVQEVPYVYELNHLTSILHDTTVTTEFDIWIELEVYGYQGGPGQGGAAVEIAGCVGRNDVYQGSLKLESTTDDTLTVPTSSYTVPLSYKYELKNYTLDGTDEINKTVKTLKFTLDTPLTNAKIHIITSNHGSNANGEEYVRRNHFIYFDNELELTYVPGGKSCEPYRIYNTQGNGIYSQFPRTEAQWLSFNNWCPGDVIPNREVSLGDVTAGEHAFRIEVPDAKFVGGQGYFPMSVYVQGEGDSGLNNEKFTVNKVSIYPNPVNDIASVDTAGLTIKAVNVVNTLGQTVFTGTTDKINMSQLQSGIYIVRVEFDNNQVAVKKIIKK